MILRRAPYSSTRLLRSACEFPRAAPVAVSFASCATAIATALAAALAVAASACSPPPRAPDTAVIASGADLESANPLVTVHPMSRQVQRYALFTTLVQLDTTLQPVPYLASRWSLERGATAVRFVLHPDVNWHDGVPTTAHDVAFTIDAARDRELGSPRAGDFAAVDSVRAETDTSVVVYYQAPLTSLPFVYAELPIAPRHILDSVPRGRWRSHSFATNPVGNGPFRFAERAAGRRWRFVRNEQFPASLGGPPSLQQLVVAVVDEASTKFAGLVSGSLDMAGVSPVMAHLVERDETLELVTPPVLFTNLLAFNTTRAPFDDVRVRRAVSLSLDRARIVNAAVAGFGTPASGIVPPGLPISPPAMAARNVSVADSLLDAAGFRRAQNGMRARGDSPLRVELLTVGSGELAIEQLVQADLRDRGIELVIRTAELAAFLTTMRAAEKTFDMAVTGIPGDLALGHVRALFATSQRGGALDYTGFHTPELDAALDRARSAPPGTAALSAWQQVDSIISAHAPVAVLYHSRGVQGKSRLLRNVTMDVRGELVTVSRWSR